MQSSSTLQTHEHGGPDLMIRYLLCPTQEETDRSKPGRKLRHSLTLGGFAFVSMPTFLTKARIRAPERCKILCFVVQKPKICPLTQRRYSKGTEPL